MVLECNRIIILAAAKSATNEIANENKINNTNECANAKVVIWTYTRSQIFDIIGIPLLCGIHFN